MFLFQERMMREASEKSRLEKLAISVSFDCSLFVCLTFFIKFAVHIAFDGREAIMELFCLRSSNFLYTVALMNAVA